jgi:hypothetical protein
MINHLTDMYHFRSQTVNKFGSDRTGQIAYCFNEQGFRSDVSFICPPAYAFFGCSSVFGIGVDINSTTAAYFKNCYNFGLAGNYTNLDIHQIIKQYLNSNLYLPTTPMVIVWTDRDQEYLNNQNTLFDHKNVYQFFCGDVITGDKKFKFVPKIDLDASNTHMGPGTHKLFAKVLWSLLDQS